MSAYITIIGLLGWDEDLIDDIFLDTFISLFRTQDTAITMLERFNDLLVYECGELEVTLPNPTYFKRIVKSWVDNQKEVWKAYYNAQQSVELEAGNILTSAKQETFTDKEGKKNTRSVNSSNNTVFTSNDNITTDNAVYGFNEANSKPKDHSLTTDDVNANTSASYDDTENGTDDRNRNYTRVTSDYGSFLDSAKKFNELSAINVLNKMIFDFRDCFCLSVY